MKNAEDIFFEAMTYFGEATAAFAILDLRKKIPECSYETIIEGVFIAYILVPELNRIERETGIEPKEEDVRKTLPLNCTGLPFTHAPLTFLITKKSA